VQEYNSATPGGAAAVEYVRGSDYGGGVGGILYTLRAGTASYTHENRRGDVIAKTGDAGPSGVMIGYLAQYQAFGSHPQQNGSTLDRQKANSKDEDPTGLLDEGFRYRDLETGSFITRDPTGFVDGPNLYTYVVQNPWTDFDPEGLDEQQANEVKKNQAVADSVASKISTVLHLALDPFGPASYPKMFADTFDSAMALGHHASSLAANDLAVNSNSKAKSMVTGAVEAVAMDSLPGEIDRAALGQGVGSDGNVENYSNGTRAVMAADAAVQVSLTLALAPGAVSAESTINLRSLTNDAHSQLGFKGNFVSTAVGQYADGSLGMASSDTMVPRAQVEWAQQKGIRVVNGEGHAETTLSDGATSQSGPLTSFEVSSPFGREVVNGVPTNPNGAICGTCAPKMQASGATTTSPVVDRPSRNQQ
jgi:RHS repeat-associated protein